MPPQVSLTSPATGTTLVAPVAQLDLTADATDSNGSITKVEFFSGSTKLGEDTVSPYSFSWTNPVSGSYSLTAKATDNQGSTTTSNPVAITISTASNFEDNFNDNSLDTIKWQANNLFSGFTDTSVPVVETGQRLEIGPLLLNAGGSHYQGLRTRDVYNFTGAYSYVELVQAASSSTAGDAMFTIGNDVNAYYRMYVSAGTLYGLRKIGATKTTLFSLPYNAANHRFLRIRHDSLTGNLVMDTASGNGGIPGPWVQQYSETWNSSIALTSMIFEVKNLVFIKCFPFHVTVSSLLIKPEVIPPTASSLNCSIEIL